MRRTVVVSLAAALAACGGGGGGGGGAGNTGNAGGNSVVQVGPPTFPLHVDVSGNFLGGLTLTDGAMQSRTIDGDGRVSFLVGLPAGSSYSVRVSRQPPTRVCTVVSGDGTVSATMTNAVAVNCTARAIASGPLVALRSSASPTGVREQHLYVRSPAQTLNSFRIGPSDGGLEVAGPDWTVVAPGYSPTFTLAPDGARVYADLLTGEVLAATVRETDGALLPTWTAVLGDYVPRLPVLLAPARVAPDGDSLYRGVILTVGGTILRDLWAGTASDSSLTVLGGSPYSLASDGGGPDFDPLGRYFVRAARSTFSIEVYPLIQSDGAAPTLRQSYAATITNRTSRSWGISSEEQNGPYLFEYGVVAEEGTAQGARPELAVHEWAGDGTLIPRGGPLAGSQLTGEIVAQICGPADTMTRRLSWMLPLPAASGSTRYVIQRQDATCVTATGLASAATYSRVLEVQVLNVAGTGTTLTRIPLDTRPESTDFGASPWAHPTKPWLYFPSKQARRVHAFVVDAAAGTLTPIAGSPFDVQGAPSSAPVRPTVIVDATGRYLYLTDDADAAGWRAIDAFTIDAASGALVSTGSYPL